MDPAGSHLRWGTSQGRDMTWTRGRGVETMGPTPGGQKAAQSGVSVETALLLGSQGKECQAGRQAPCLPVSSVSQSGCIAQMVLPLWASPSIK